MEKPHINNLKRFTDHVRTSVEQKTPLAPEARMFRALEAFGRERLSKHYFMRDFLYSGIAAVHGIPNIPDDPERAIEAGKGLCEHLLEPLQTISTASRSVPPSAACPDWFGDAPLPVPLAAGMAKAAGEGGD